MQAHFTEFGQIEINGETYYKDVIIDRGIVKRRDKRPSKRHRHRYGHTPLSATEAIPWDCKRLIVGTGMYGKLPIMDAVYAEAEARSIELVVCTTGEACDLLRASEGDANAVLHITC